MDDLYAIYREKLAAGIVTIQAHRWLLRESHHPLSIGFKDYSLAKNSKLRAGEPISNGPPLRIDGIEITEVRAHEVLFEGIVGKTVFGSVATVATAAQRLTPIAR